MIFIIIKFLISYTSVKEIEKNGSSKEKIKLYNFLFLNIILYVNLFLGFVLYDYSEA